MASKSKSAMQSLAIVVAGGVVTALVLGAGRSLFSGGSSAQAGSIDPARYDAISPSAIPAAVRASVNVPSATVYTFGGNSQSRPQAANTTFYNHPFMNA